jgi:hypothetical protein
MNSGDFEKVDAPAGTLDYVLPDVAQTGRRFRQLRARAEITSHFGAGPKRLAAQRGGWRRDGNQSPEGNHRADDSRNSVILARTRSREARGSRKIGS